jgi:hypothetical protein
MELAIDSCVLGRPCDFVSVLEQRDFAGRVFTGIGAPSLKEGMAELDCVNVYMKRR